MLFHSALKEAKIRHLNLPSPTRVAPTISVEEAIRKMRRTSCACALVVENDKILGIITERDVLNKVVGRPAILPQPVKDLMTPDPVTLSTEDSLSRAIDVMCEGGYRNVPITDAEGRPVASLPASEIVKYIVEHFPKDVFNLPPRLEQRMATPDGA